MSKQKKYKCIIFDLDGTLLDTSPGVIESVEYAVNKMHYDRLSFETLRTFIGPPMRESFITHFGCSDEEAETATGFFREHYVNEALFKAEPYDGIFELCAELVKRGYVLAVATNKPLEQAKSILERFGFDQYLTHVFGADLDGNLTKTDLIRCCAEAAGAEQVECMMIGDTQHDASGAQRAGVDFIGMTYGFGDIDRMRKYPIVALADKPTDVIAILEESEID